MSFGVFVDFGDPSPSLDFGNAAHALPFRAYLIGSRLDDRASNVHERDVSEYRVFFDHLRRGLAFLGLVFLLRLTIRALLRAASTIMWATMRQNSSAAGLIVLKLVHLLSAGCCSHDPMRLCSP